MTSLSVDVRFSVSQSKKTDLQHISQLWGSRSTQNLLYKRKANLPNVWPSHISNPGNTLCFHARHICLGRKVFSMPFHTVQVVCDSRSIFILRDGDCMTETHITDVAVNFTIKILVANVEA